MDTQCAYARGQVVVGSTGAAEGTMMKPTNRFRFLLTFKGKKEVKTLQQWWEEEPSPSRMKFYAIESPDSPIMGEWREIPIDTQEEYL